MGISKLMSRVMGISKFMGRAMGISRDASVAKIIPIAHAVPKTDSGSHTQAVYDGLITGKYHEDTRNDCVPKNGSSR